MFIDIFTDLSTKNEDEAIATSRDETGQILNYKGTTKPLKTVILRSPLGYDSITLLWHIP
jgi:hypothetical protein